MSTETLATLRATFETAHAAAAKTAKARGLRSSALYAAIAADPAVIAARIPLDAAQGALATPTPAPTATQIAERADRDAYRSFLRAAGDGADRADPRAHTESDDC